MKRILLGKSAGKNVYIDLDVLLATRLLVQANSGGGKSYTFRRILEQAFGKVQCVVIDPADEFTSLREKFGYVLVGEGGETPMDVRSAALVATKLLELKASAVCNLYGLKPHERHIWVQRFFEAVMNAPKKLWHPVIFAVDEAHKFCPESGEGESEAKEYMLSLASDGRKYGFCAMFATQRLAKLDKTAAAELLNVLIGPTFIDLDLERAQKALGIVKADKQLFNDQMKTIEPGNFWAFGRAISKHRLLVKIGGIETTHPKAGDTSMAVAPPPTPAKIKALLPKLADLPQHAEEKAQTEREYKTQIRELKLALAEAKKQQPKPSAGSGRTVADPAQAAEIRQLRKALEQAMKFIVQISVLNFDGTVPDAEMKAAIDAGVSRALQIVERKVDSRNAQVAALKKQADAILAALKAIKKDATVRVDVSVNRREPFAVESVPAVQTTRPALMPARTSDGASLEKGLLSMLKAVAQYPNGASRTQLTILTGYKKSTRNRYLQLLTQKALAVEERELFFATQEGIDALGANFEPLPTGRALIDHWLKELPEGEKNIFQVLVNSYPSYVDREAISEATGYMKSTRNRYLQLLAARCITEESRDGLCAAAMLFES